MLLMAGESTVSSLGTADSGIDTDTATLLLEQFIDDFLMRGSVGNRVLKKCTIASAGKIELDAKTIVAELTSFHENDEGYTIVGQLRGVDEDLSTLPYLYNVTDQSDQWKASTDYYVEYILDIDWEDIATPMQRAIMAAAARQYQIIMQGDADADAYLAQAEAFYAAKSKAANTDDRRRHIFDQLPAKARDSVNRSSRYNDRSRFRFWRTRS